MGKRFRAGKALGKFYRMFAVIFVVDSDSRVSDFKRRGEWKQDDLNQHRQNQDRARLWFA